MFQDNEEKYTILKAVFGGYCLLVMAWTAYIAFKQAGVVYAVISFFVPVISQAYWFYKYMGLSQSFTSPFCLACLLFFPAVIALGIVVSEERKSKQ